MKKMKGFRAFVALSLAVMMVFSAVAVVADEPETKVEVVVSQGNTETLTETSQDSNTYEYGDGSEDAQSVTVTDVVNGDTVDIDLNNISNNNGDGVEIQNNSGTIDIDAKNVTGEKNNGVEIQSNSGNIDIDAKSVTGKDGDGIHVGPTDPTSADASNTSTGKITFDVGDVSGTSDGIEINSNAGTVNISQETKPDPNNNNEQTETIITGEHKGINIQNNAGTVTSNQGEKATPGNVKATGDESKGILINGNAEGKTIDLNHNEVTGKQNGIEIQSNAGTIDIDANSVKATNGDGIRIASGSSYDSVSNTGTINIDTIGNVSGGESGIQIVGNAGNVNINMDDKQNPRSNVDGRTGIGIDKNSGNINICANIINANRSSGISINRSTADSDIDITANTIIGGVYLENNLGKINIYGDNFSEGKGINIKKHNTKGDFTLVASADPGNKITANAGDGFSFETNSEGNNSIQLFIDDISATGNNSKGMYISSSGNANTTVSTVGNVTVSGDKDSTGERYGVYLFAQEAVNNVTVGGNISAERVGNEVYGLAILYRTDGENHVLVEGGITASVLDPDAANGDYGDRSYGIAAIGDSSITVLGDVVATGGKNESTGLRLSVYNSDKTDVVIDGTLYGDKTAIQLTNAESDATATAENAEVTVWGLKTGEGGTLVSGDDAKGTFAAAINYIAKATKSAAELLTITGKQEKTVTIGVGEGAKEQTYQTAKQDEEVTITLGENEGLDSIYYFYDDKKQAGKDTDLLTIGNGITAVADSINSFVVKMRAAGGMLLGGLKTHTHDFVLESVTKAATCTESGTAVYKCSVCGATKQGTIAAKGHTEVTDAAVAATCTTAGKTAGSHCSTCGAVIKAQEVIPAGHTEVADAAVAATCTTAGKTAGSHCSACGTVIKAQVTVPAKGHTEVADAAVAATCTTAGKTAGSHCSACGTVIKAQEVVKAKGHTEVADAAVAATCTTAGKTAGSHCSDCGAVIKAQEEVPAKGHTSAAAVRENEKAAKVGVAGSYDEVVYCKDCGAEISRETVTVPALPEPEKQEENRKQDQGTAVTVDAADKSSATTSAFDAFCNELVWKIRNTPQNGTVEADAGDFPGLMQKVFEALNDRPDVSLKLKTRDGEITIPAGAGLLEKVSRGVVTWAEIRGLV